MACCTAASVVSGSDHHNSASKCSSTATSGSGKRRRPATLLSRSTSTTYTKSANHFIETDLWTLHKCALAVSPPTGNHPYRYAPRSNYLLSLPTLQVCFKSYSLLGGSWDLASMGYKCLNWGPKWLFLQALLITLVTKSHDLKY